MARRKTDNAEVYIGSNKVQHYNDITFVTPDREPVISDPLNADDVDVIDVSARPQPFALEINCDLDSEDTNGQVAMKTAHDNGSTVVLNYYPEGKTTGNEQHTGNAYVTRVPNVGGQGKGVPAKGTFYLVWASKPVEGTVPA